MPVKGGYLFVAGAGGVLLWSGLTGKSWSQVFRDVLTGQNPQTTLTAYTIHPGTPPTSQDLGNQSGGGGSGGGGPTVKGSALASFAVGFQGVPYKWGGWLPRTGWDCSGMVNYCLHHGNISSHGPIASYYLFWRGAVTVSRNQCTGGDLVCYPGHVGIAISQNSFVSALNPTEGTAISNIWAGAKIRRIK